MKYYLADAFTDSLFYGNPAGVCVCEHWPSDGMMQRIAGENNLPETAFLCREEGGWRIRWFTSVPTCSIYAALSSATRVYSWPQMVIVTLFAMSSSYLCKPQKESYRYRIHYTIKSRREKPFLTKRRIL